MARKPKCFGQYSGVPKCSSCGHFRTCKSIMSRSTRPWRGLSRSKAQKAFCGTCVGSLRAGCVDASCPHYAFLVEKRQLAGPPDLWWNLYPAREWVAAEKAARMKKRVIREDVPGEEDEVDEMDEEDGGE